MSATTGAQSIPTALVVPIIEAYVHGIREAFAFLLVSTVFDSILFPLLILLFALSTKQTRRKPIFILTVIKPILAPFDPINLTEGLFFTVLDVWLPWISEVILLVRIAVVFPRAKLPLLIAFPIAIKIGRVVLSIIFSIRWVKLTLANGSACHFAVLEDLRRPLFKASFFLELFDNTYVSLLFLWRLRMKSQPRFFEGSAIERISVSNSKRSQDYAVIFGLLRIITTFVAKNAVLYSVFYTVNSYVAIISTVFATIWSSTVSLKEALQDQSDTIASSRPVVFNMERTMDTARSAPPSRTVEPVEEPKTETWDEPK
ncbi:hypothetical protein FB451DRAFT_1174183 [Mycena latifolia]|nr:hypothetical protein FB451DRAFT_1174183 [Mycena latifolia]